MLLEVSVFAFGALITVVIVLLQLTTKTTSKTGNAEFEYLKEHMTSGLMPVLSMLLIVVIYAPITEEVLIYSMLMYVDYIGFTAHKEITIGITFGLIHITNYFVLKSAYGILIDKRGTSLQVINTTYLGIALRYISKDLIYCIVFHGVFNAFSLFIFGITVVLPSLRHRKRIQKEAESKPIAIADIHITDDKAVIVCITRRASISHSASEVDRDSIFFGETRTKKRTYYDLDLGGSFNMYDIIHRSHHDKKMPFDISRLCDYLSPT